MAHHFKIKKNKARDGILGAGPGHKNGPEAETVDES